MGLGARLLLPDGSMGQKFPPVKMEATDRPLTVTQRTPPYRKTGIFTPNDLTV